MADEHITTIGTCYGCKRTFAFDPGSVTMFLIDPETDLPPGMTVLGTTREPTPEAVARSVNKPVCPDCVRKAQRVGQADDPSADWGTWPRTT